MLKFLLLLLLLGVVYSWMEDDRCLRRRRHLIFMETEEDELSSNMIGSSKKDTIETRLLTTRELQSDFRFNLKMYWEEGFCWQEEWIERKWCMECAGSKCNEDDILEIQVCDNTARQEFSWIPRTQGAGGRLKVSGSNLCFERISNNNYQLKTCSVSIKQVLVGVNPNPAEPFELYPFGEGENKCLNQHHHPKAFEVIHTTSCSLARLYHTNRWQVYWPAGTHDGTDYGNESTNLKSRSPTCSSNKPCGECLGDCDNDSECEGNLKCYQRRRGASALDPIPGCSGSGRRGRDYCYSPDSTDPNDGSPSTGDSFGGSSIPLVRPTRDCSDANLCGECEGDCDADTNCRGNLVCFQKDGYLDVPGCDGRDASRTDFCVDPTKI
jgi:hypothetical protein